MTRTSWVRQLAASLTLCVAVAACTGDTATVPENTAKPGENPSASTTSSTESSTTTQASPSTDETTRTTSPPASKSNGEMTLEANKLMIKSQPWRNISTDNSPWRDVPQDELVVDEILGNPDRAEYVDTEGKYNNQGFHFPTNAGGQFRVACEFSHFGYDDPVLFPGEVGAAHLHMFFGNTDITAATTTESLENSGGSTCNGAELNRSGYWVPAMFDAEGNVRIPERIVVYYKGEGLANAGQRPTYPSYGGEFDGRENPGAQPFISGMANIAPIGQSVAEIPTANGGAEGEANYKCSDNFSVNTDVKGVANIPVCDGDDNANDFPNFRTVLEVETKFFNCFPTYDETTGEFVGAGFKEADVGDWKLWQPAGDERGGWFFSNCSGRGGGPTDNLDNFETYPNVTFFVNYVVEPGETTEGWHLSSDVDEETLGDQVPSIVAGGAGSTNHGDSFWAWQKEINQMFLDNCVNFSNSTWVQGGPNIEGPKSGCGFGYLTDGGPDNKNPLPGPTLKRADEYDDPLNLDVFSDEAPGTYNGHKIPAEVLHKALCPSPIHRYETSRHAAYCRPGGHSH